MLEKNAEKMFFDAHFHYFYSKNYEIPANYYGCSCAHSPKEWNFQVENAPSSIIFSYGIHPQSCGFDDLQTNADFLEGLLHQKFENVKSGEGGGNSCNFPNPEKSFLSAIGEAGFDYFTSEFLEHKSEQEKAWNIQLELAQKYKMPLVVHCRKANHKLFEYSKQLKNLPSVLFHSFMGPPAEAKSLLNRGINAFFSFGKQIKNNNKKVIACVKELSVENLLLETDAPFQFLKNEHFTRPADISTVYEAAIEVRKCNIEEFFTILEANYRTMFGL